ncbi:MAG: hypothetical protein V2I48_01655, partial [Xanthomonadales bacterium]|nr:hypothetical protein [Xanthomonadales bacterium]
LLCLRQNRTFLKSLCSTTLRRLLLAGANRKHGAFRFPAPIAARWKAAARTAAFGTRSFACGKTAPFSKACAQLH